MQNDSYIEEPTEENIVRQRLKELLNSFNGNQSHLAKVAGLNLTSVWRLVNGKSSLGLHTALALAKAEITKGGISPEESRKKWRALVNDARRHNHRPMKPKGDTKAFPFPDLLILATTMTKKPASIAELRHLWVKCAELSEYGISISPEVADKIMEKF